MKIVITGGHSGIGLELTRLLINKPEHSIGLVMRAKSRVQDLPPEIRDANNLTVWEADLSVQTQVVTVAKTILKDWGSVDVLFNNADSANFWAHICSRS